MNRRSFLKSCAALLTAVAAPVVAKEPQVLIGSYESFRFVETETFWDLTREYGWALPFTDNRSMLWAAAHLKRHADELVPPFGLAELRVMRGLNYGTENAIAIYWAPSLRGEEVRYLPPKFEPERGYYLLERFGRD